jgi:methionyl-tRNA formyltransferase
MGNTLKNYAVVTEKKWHDSLYNELVQTIPAKWYRIKSKQEFTIDLLKDLKPQVIFIPHWSYLIPEEIYTTYECIVFHMTDLPYGRGGSPLQNLIVRGHTTTMLSALRVTQEIDAGPVYQKKALSLTGTAQQILERAAELMYGMIKEIIEQQPVPQPQVGEIVRFKRRKPAESNMAELQRIEQVYDYIRMLDADGYPPAYIENDHFRFEFTQAVYDNGKLEAHVRIIQK